MRSLVGILPPPCTHAFSSRSEAGGYGSERTIQSGEKQRFQNELRKLLRCHWLTSRLRLPQELPQGNNAVFTYLELASARSSWMRNWTIHLDNSARVDLENC